MYQEESDPNFNPLTRKPMAQHKRKSQKRKRGRPRLFSLEFKRNRRSDSKKGSQNNEDSTNDMGDTNEDMNHSASKADLAHDMTDCDVGDTEVSRYLSTNTIGFVLQLVVPGFFLLLFS